VARLNAGPAGHPQMREAAYRRQTGDRV